MLCTRMAWCCLGALAVATWLATAHAQEQDNFHMVATGDSSDNGEETGELRSEISGLHSSMKATVSGGYEQGPTCGCMAHGEPSCGCMAHGEPSCGCQGGCGCGVEVGCGCDGGCGCASACCCEEDCCGCCCAPGCSCGFYGGAEVIWMKPHWDSMTSLISTRDATAVDSSGYDYSFDPTARFFIGYTGCSGVGVRASWWEFDHKSDLEAGTVANGVTEVESLGFDTATAGRTITTQQSLELQNLDLEFTECFEACGGNLIASFGGRYAKFDLRTHERLYAPTGALLDTFEHEDRFEGFGPTMGIEFLRPLCCSGLSFYSSLRGSIIFDDSHTSDRYFTPAGVLEPPGHTREENTVRNILDLQLAVQYCRGAWFFRGGWQAQYWDAAAHTGFGNDAADGKASLGLEGFFLTLGASR